MNLMHSDKRNLSIVIGHLKEDPQIFCDDRHLALDLENVKFCKLCPFLENGGYTDSSAQFVYYRFIAVI